MNTRIVSLLVTPADFARLGVDGLTAELKKRGFVFVTETCPFVLQEPKEVLPIADGAVLYSQWLPE